MGRAAELIEKILELCEMGMPVRKAIAIVEAIESEKEMGICN